MFDDTVVITSAEYSELLNYKKENAMLKIELQRVSEHLKHYTAPAKNKEYYHEHRETILQKAKEISSEKKKQYNDRYYSKQKLKKMAEPIETNETLGKMVSDS